MDEHALLVLMSVFVFVAAVALLIQAGFLFGIYKTFRSIHEHTLRVLPKVEALVPKVEALVTSSQITVDDGRLKMAELTVKAQTILDTTQRQMHTVDSFLTDAAERGRVQMDRAEMFLDDAMGRAQETVAMVHGTVIAPIRQINGLAMGLRAALQFFLRGNRPSPDRATVDEEMFI